MPKNKYFFLLQHFLCFVLIVYLSNCASSNHNRRGKLSDAMEKASDESDDRVVETEPDPEPEYYEDEDDEDDYEYVSGFNSEDTLSEHGHYNKPGFNPSFTWFSISAGTGLIKGKDFFGLTHFNLGFGGFLQPHHKLEIDAGFAWAPLQQTSTLKYSLDGGAALLNLGLNYKWITTPQHTFLGQYFTFGLRYNYMMWSYKNPILADTYDDWGNYSGTEEISHDGLSGFEFYSGFGLHILQVEGFQIGGEVSPGVIFWVWETTEGFENDVFSTFWYVKFKVLINFKIN